MIKKWFYAACMLGMVVSVVSCENQKFSDVKVDVDEVDVDELSPELLKVRDYVPEYAVIAHRGSTYWTPEETEAAYRWAREIGVDYLECDMQVSKDGVVLALHDDNLKRTTNIESVFGETLPREIRTSYYLNLGYSQLEAEAMVRADEKSFVPNLPAYYTYEELLMLDAGEWFNDDSLEEALDGFYRQKQYVSTLEDLIMYSKGYRLKRVDNEPARYPRVFSIVGKTGETIASLSGTADVVEYKFEYEVDPVWLAGKQHLPGIYLEFKEPWLNPKGFEKLVYDVLASVKDMNVIEKPEPENVPFYVEGRVNVGNTNGKVILQTFSLESLVRISEVYEGKIPMCFLLWKGGGATDLTYADPLGYASFINLGVKYKAHFMGPCISGAPNNYPELNLPWQDYLIRRSGMKNHPYTFDTYDQMARYFGQYNFGVTDGMYRAPYLDALFTNHADMSINYMITQGWRRSPASQELVDARQVLESLGYIEMGN